MDTHPLARRMQELNWWIDTQEDLAVERHEFNRAPFGRARLAIDPASTAPAASMNRNRIHLCGTEGGLTRTGLAELAGMFTQRGVERYFVWLSPGPADIMVREWLGAMSFTRVKWTRYPTLLYAEPLGPRVHPFDIREANAADLSAARADLGECVMQGYARTIGRDGFRHYILFDRDRPIAVAALVTHAQIGYLTYAGTVESERRRGAQCALIAHRVAVAEALGCRHILSQTLTMLEGSFANLKRCGFREVYEQEAYESPQATGQE